MRAGHRSWLSPVTTSSSCTSTLEPQAGIRGLGYELRTKFRLGGPIGNYMGFWGDL